MAYESGKISKEDFSNSLGILYDQLNNQYQQYRSDYSPDGETPIMRLTNSDIDKYQSVLKNLEQSKKYLDGTYSSGLFGKDKELSDFYGDIQDNGWSKLDLVRDYNLWKRAGGSLQIIGGVGEALSGIAIAA